MKRLLIICDGMADEPIYELGEQTPFEAAHTPNMDILAKMGHTGLLQNCPPEFPAGSDTAILSVFGYDPKRFYTGRASLEAADCGMTLHPGQFALRTSFLQVENGVIRSVVSQCPVEKLLKRPEFSAVPGFRLVPQKNGQPLAVLDSDPGTLVQPHDHVGEKLTDLLPHHPTLQGMIHASLAILEQEKMCIWFWGTGTGCVLPPFPVDGTLISATPLCRGIGILAGLWVPTVPGTTGDLNTDYLAKSYAAIDAFREGKEFAAIHIEAPDACSHRLDISGKLEAIARIDKMLPPVLKYLRSCGEDYRILILSDHQTSCRTGRHSHAPVPYIVYDSLGRDRVGTPMQILFS